MSTEGLRPVETSIQRAELRLPITVDAPTSIIAAYRAGVNIATAINEIEKMNSNLGKAHAYLDVSRALTAGGANPDTTLKLAYSHASFERDRGLKPYQSRDARHEHLSNFNDILLSIIEIEASQGNTRTSKHVDEVYSSIEGYTGPLSEFQGRGVEWRTTQTTKAHHLVKLAEIVLKFPDSFTINVDQIIAQLKELVGNETYKINASHQEEAEVLKDIVRLQLTAGYFDAAQETIEELKLVPHGGKIRSHVGEETESPLLAAKVAGLTEAGITQMQIAMLRKEELTPDDIRDILTSKNPEAIRALGYSMNVNIDDYSDLADNETEGLFLDGQHDKLRDRQVELQTHQRLLEARKRELDSQD